MAKLKVVNVTGEERARVIAAANKRVDDDNELDAKFKGKAGFPADLVPDPPIADAPSVRTFKHPVVPGVYGLIMGISADETIEYVVFPNGEAWRSYQWHAETGDELFFDVIVQSRPTDHGILSWCYDPADPENSFPWYCHAHRDDTTLDQRRAMPVIDELRTFYRTEFKLGQVVFPVFFHENCPGGWTVLSADGKVSEYWQADPEIDGQVKYIEKLREG